MSPYFHNLTFLMFLIGIKPCWKTRTPCRWFGGFCLFFESVSLASPLSLPCAVTMSPTLSTTLLCAGKGRRRGHPFCWFLLISTTGAEQWWASSSSISVSWWRGLMEQDLNHHSTVKCVHKHLSHYSAVPLSRQC